VSAAGLTEVEASRRLAERGPPAPPATSRSTASIVRANVLTPFNAILAVLGVLTLVFADWRDALFLFIIVANSGIGIWQELRAKRSLDRLASLVAPKATVVRDGATRDVAVGEVVKGDLVQIQAGDQVVADGPVSESAGLALDESILTGESRPIQRSPGEEVRSGSFAVEGAGSYTVEAVGDDSYAQRLAGEAREFRHPRSPLEVAVNYLLYALVGLMVPLGLMLLVVLVKGESSTREAITTAVAGIVTLVPEGLILLMSVTFAAAALQLSRRGALAQQLNAIESLASVDLICLDKTGTLTEPGLRVVSLEPAAGVDEGRLRGELARFAASSPSKNATLLALGGIGDAPVEEVSESVPFSSSRRWSALRLGGEGFVLGAPELFPLGPLAAVAEEEQRAGRRVVAFGTTNGSFEQLDGLEPLGVAVLAEELRAQARDTVGFFQQEGVELKVMSGDAPETVGAIARDAGIEGEVTAGDQPVEVLVGAAVVGRISPEGKRAVVEALRDRGRYVAMVGDGVNDVPALKASRLAIAQGSGSEMARSVADVVLVNGDFAAVPEMVAQGRKILRNLQRVTKLFAAKSAFAAFLILSIGLTDEPYPLLPRHLTLAATLTVGVPAFFLALAPSSGPWRTEGFLREVGRFAVPAGTFAGIGVLFAYLFTVNVAGVPLEEARTAATTVLIAIGLYLVVALEAAPGTRRTWVGILVGGLVLTYLIVLAVGGLRHFFGLETLGGWGLLGTLGGITVAVGGLLLTDSRFMPGRAGEASGQAVSRV
jgi:magnesium-transporting ATPase (P-type)